MGDITGLAAVVMLFSIPIVGIAVYGYYRVSKLRTEERLAALARGVNVPMEPELSQAARSRRAGILLVSAAIGYVITFALIARVEPDAWVAASFGAIPFTVGLGFFLDSTSRPARSESRGLNELCSSTFRQIWTRTVPQVRARSLGANLGLPRMPPTISKQLWRPTLAQRARERGAPSVQEMPAV